MSETLVQEAEAKVEAVAAEVKTEAVKVEGEVVSEVKAEVAKIIQELSAEEKLAIREVENAYLKAQIEIQRLSQITKEAQQKFTTLIEGFAKKYVLNTAEWVFDNVALIWKKK
jgi:SMC interacting uncharacterized protein involved in chromosome segregation